MMGKNCVRALDSQEVSDHFCAHLPRFERQSCFRQCALVQQNEAIAPPDSESPLGFGYSLALSRNGQTVMIGDVQKTTNDRQGKVFIYSTQDALSDLTLNQTLSGADWFGAKVATSANATTIAVGGFGSVSVFHRSPSDALYSPTAHSVINGAAVNATFDSFGMNAVALNDAGDLLFVGFVEAEGKCSQVAVYSISSSPPSLKCIISVDNESVSVSNISLSGDGSSLAISSDRRAQMWVRNTQTGCYDHFQSLYVAPTESNIRELEMALSQDGSTVALSGLPSYFAFLQIYHRSDSTEVYKIAFNGQSLLTQSIVYPSCVARLSLSAGGERLAVGFPCVSSAFVVASAFVVTFDLDFDNQTFSEGKKLTGSSYYDYVGFAVALSPDGTQVFTTAMRNDGIAERFSTYRVTPAATCAALSWRHESLEACRPFSRCGYGRARVRGLNCINSFEGVVNDSYCVGTAEERFTAPCIESCVVNTSYSIPGSFQSVAISRNGSIIALTEQPHLFPGGAPKVFIYGRDSFSDDYFLRQKLFPTTAQVTATSVSVSVAISGDASVIAVGIPLYNATNDLGRVEIYQWNSTQKNYSSVSASEDMGYGYSLSFSQDGHVFAMGLRQIGGAKLFARRPSGFIEVYHVGVSPNTDTNVDVSDDGSTIVATAVSSFLSDNPYKIVSSTAGVLCEFSGRIDEDLMKPLAVSLTRNGSFVAIGVPNDIYFGKVIILQRRIDHCTYEKALVINNDESPNFGKSVTLSSDGALLMVATENSVLVYALDLIERSFQLMSTSTTEFFSTAVMSRDGEVIGVSYPHSRFDILTIRPSTNN